MFILPVPCKVKYNFSVFAAVKNNRNEILFSMNLVLEIIFTLRTLDRPYLYGEK